MEQPKLIGHYTVLDLIGKGGMGRVHKGRDTRNGTLVAIKFLESGSLTEDPQLLERLKREGEALRLLNHPNIVKMLDVIQNKGEYALILEYVDGGSLWDLLQKGAPMPLSQVLKISLELADALTRAHYLKIIHRDIKPGNIMLSTEGITRLTDFGVARLGSFETMTAKGSVIGSPNYMSPEAIHGEAPDPRMDIWSFGVVLFEMLTGIRPFDANSPAATMFRIVSDPLPNLATLRPDLSPTLVWLIHRMLDKDPVQRLASARRVGAELEHIIEQSDTDVRKALDTSGYHFDPTPSSTEQGKTVLIPETKGVEHVTKEASAKAVLNRRWLLGAALLVILISTGIGIVLGNFIKDEKTPKSAEIVQVEPVESDEVMILLGQLEPLGDERPSIDRFILEDLQTSIEQSTPLAKAKLRAYPQVITSSEDAMRIADANQAQIMLWGYYTDEFIEIEIQLNHYDPAQISIDYLKKAGTVRVRITDERSQSIANQVLTSLIMIHSFENKPFETASALVSINELGIENAQIEGNYTGASVYRAYEMFYSDPEAALTEFDQALRLDSSNPMIYHLRSILLARFARLDEAEQAANAAIRLSGNEWSAAYANLGGIKLTQNDYEAAKMYFNNAIEFAPEEWFNYTVRGILYYLTGDFIGSEADFQQSIARHPAVGWPYIFSSMTALREGRLDDVNSLLQTALTEYPDPASGMRVVLAAVSSVDDSSALLGFILSGFANLSLGQYDQAIEATNNALKIRQDIPELYMLRGVAYCVRMDYEDAEDSYTSALALDPDFTVIYLLRADVRNRMKDVAGSLLDLSAAQQTTNWDKFEPTVNAALASGTSALGCESFFGS